jgi:biopolymer transport protein ExbB
MNMLADNIIVKGGWVMVPIIIGSIIAFALAIERGAVLWRAWLDVRKFSDDIFSLIGAGEFAQALAACRAVGHPIGRVFQVCIERRGEDAADVERMMEHEGNELVAKLEKNMHIFMIVVGVEPLLGFLGTILGLIQAFMAWEMAATTVTVEQLAAGIYQAMITTGGGLIVAIPFYIVYSIYMSRINRIAWDLNHYGEELLITMKDKTPRKRK